MKKFKTSVDVMRAGIRIDRDSFSIDTDYEYENISDEELEKLFNLIPNLQEYKE